MEISSCKDCVRENVACKRINTRACRENKTLSQSKLGACFAYATPGWIPSTDVMPRYMNKKSTTEVLRAEHRGRKISSTNSVGKTDDLCKNDEIGPLLHSLHIYLLNMY